MNRGAPRLFVRRILDHELDASVVLTPLLGFVGVDWLLLTVAHRGQPLCGGSAADHDGDGISGRVNRVWSVEAQRTVVGRFGWKANTASLREQAASAYLDDMGVSNPVHTAADGEFDIDTETLEATTFYTQTLAVPRRQPLDDVAKRGAAQFFELGCASCHVPQLETGDSEVDALAHQHIAPYSDLLLHDLGPDLADHRPDFQASGAEWRTPPL